MRPDIINNKSGPNINRSTGSVGELAEAAVVLANGATSVSFYYSPEGQLLEEFENDDTGAYGSPVYYLTDHVYLGDLEIARVIHGPKYDPCQRQSNEL